MTKFQLSRADAPWDYPSLGFRADTSTAILDGSTFDPPITTPPDVWWTVYGGGSGETGITRYTFPVVPASSPPEPTDGHFLVYDANLNTYVPTAPTAALTPVADAVNEGLIEDPASLTSVALSATIAEVSPRRDTLPTRTLAKLRAAAAVKFTALGDSVLQGSTATTPGTDDAMSLLASTLTSRFGSTVTKSNQALGGHTAAWEVLDRWATALTDNSDLYILGITGKNDITYEVTASGISKYTGHKTSSSLALIESKIRELRVRKPGADIVLMSGNPYGSAYTSANAAQKAYSKGLAELAGHYGLAYADGWNAVATTGQDYAAAGDLSDGVHPNSAGHAKLATAILNLFPADYDPATSLVTPSAGLPERIYPKHATKMVSITAGSTTAYTDRLINPSFTGTWTGAGPWTTSTAGAKAEFQAKATDIFTRFTYGAGQGVVDIIVDGQDYAMALDLSTLTDADQILGAFDLAPGVHNVTIRQVSGTVTLESIHYLAAASEWIDIRDTRVTTASMGAASDLNQYYGIHSNATAVGASITFDFVGTGLTMQCARGATGSGAYFAAGTLDGAAFTPPVVPTGFSGYGSVPVVSGLEYGKHSITINLQATGLTIGGFSVLDERPEQHPGICSGVAKAGETVRFPLPYLDAPSVDVTSTTANAAGASTVTATSFLVTGTAGDVVRWSARAPQRVLY